jgi:hypothetical protein
MGDRGLDDTHLWIVRPKIMLEKGLLLKLLTCGVYRLTSLEGVGK